MCTMIIFFSFIVGVTEEKKKYEVSMSSAICFGSDSTAHRS